MGDPAVPGKGDEAKKAATEAAEKLMAGVSAPNYQKNRVIEAIKKAVTEEMKKDAATQESVKAAILKAVDDNIEKPEAPKDDKKREAFDAQQKKDRETLETSANTLAGKVMDLKANFGAEQGAKIFEEKMNKAGPALPISNTTLLAGGAAAAVTLFRPWDGFKNIAINLGIIAAGIAGGAYLSGDLTYLTGKKKEETKSPSV